MKLFSMGGAQITGPLVFRQNFDPQDLLCNPELAAGFAYQQLRQLSALDKYSSELLFQAVFMPELCLGGLALESPGDYFSLAALETLGEAEAEVVTRLAEGEDAQRALKAVWDIASGAVPSESQDRGRLFLILSAGYFLARSAPWERPIGPREAASAYCKRPIARDTGLWLELQSGSIQLPAQTEPYRILLDERRLAALPDGEELSLCRVSAPSEVPLRLELYRGKYDDSPKVELIEPGDYRYLTLAGGRPVHLHPVQAENGYCTMVRRGSKLLSRMYGGEWKTIPLKRDLVSFAPEQDGNGYIAVLPDGKLELAHYSLGRLPAVARRLCSGLAVEADIRGAACLVLLCDGTVVSNLADVHANGLSRLDALTFMKRR
jgi:hypothetical protein